MKIEKLNEQQIRCTLTIEDLAVRHIKLSELAYGSDKMRELFQDMMEQAAVDLGFDTEDIPLMVEAIPMSAGQIVLIITKVESPDELDTRFSEFSHCQEVEVEEAEETGEDPQAELDLPEDLLALLGEIKRELTEAGECPAAIGERAKQEEAVSLFSFAQIDTAVPAAKAVCETFAGQSALYRDGEGGDYRLILHQGGHSAMEFNRVCHTLTAYLQKEKCTAGTEAYLKEHGRVILAEQAVQTLAAL